jgi:hypothetical protein
MFRIRSSKPKRVLWVGKKTRRWMSVRAKLKRKFEAMGVTRCEFNFTEHCTPDNFLSFAHSKKRVDCKTDADMEEVGLACFSCHSVLDEHMTHEEMYKAVTNVIKQRDTQRTSEHNGI